MRRLYILVFLSVFTFSGCAAMMARHRAHMRERIASEGEFALEVQAEVDNAGLTGQVIADGCVEWEEIPPQPWTPMDDDEEAEEKEPEVVLRRFCDRFPVSDALVVAQFGQVEVIVRTDPEGYFSITDASDLASIVGQGGRGSVMAQWRGQRAETYLGAATLADAAALSLLDQLRDPPLPELARFVVQWERTPAADLARARFHEQTCGALARQLSEGIESGELADLQALDAQWSPEIRRAFCSSSCEVECRALDSLTPLMEELARHGR